MTEYVAIDREKTNSDKLSPSSVLSATAPTALNLSTAMTAIPMGNGLVRYQTNSSGSGSNVYDTFVFSKAHRLVRVELELLTSSTSGTADDFTGQVSFGVLTRNNQPASTELINQMFFSTNGTPTTTDNIVFVGGEGYETDPCTYVLEFVAPNSDFLLVNIVVQYL